MSLTPTSTPPHVGPGLPSDPVPAMVHVRRPSGSSSETVQIDSVRTAGADELDLPPVVLRLPNLATFTKGLPHTSIASIAHWVFLALGGLLALWLIFGGRAKPLPAVDEAPAFTQPARAEASSTPTWNPPPLESAGDSEAPSWKPPAAATPAVEPVQAPAFEVQAPAPAAAPAAEQPAGQEPAAAPSQSESYSGGESSVAQSAPAYEAWPGAEQTTAAAPGQPPVAAAAGSGPVLRTAQREPAPAAASSGPAPGTPVPAAAGDTLPPGDVEPLGITVPVPQ